MASLQMTASEIPQRASCVLRIEPATSLRTMRTRVSASWTRRSHGRLLTYFQTTSRARQSLALIRRSTSRRLPWPTKRELPTTTTMCGLSATHRESSWVHGRETTIILRWCGALQRSSLPPCGGRSCCTPFKNILQTNSYRPPQKIVSRFQQFCAESGTRIRQRGSTKFCIGSKKMTHVVGGLRIPRATHNSPIGNTLCNCGQALNRARAQHQDSMSRAHLVSPHLLREILFSLASPSSLLLITRNPRMLRVSPTT